MVLVVKNPPASAREMWVRSLGWEDPLEWEIATHSSISPGESPWTEEPGRLQFVGLQSRARLKRLSTHAHSINRPYHTARGISVPQPGVYLTSLALKVQSLNHCTAREVPCKCNFYAPGNQNKIVWHALLYSLYCRGLEPNLQYLWDEYVSAPNIKAPSDKMHIKSSSRWYSILLHGEECHHIHP